MTSDKPCVPRWLIMLNNLTANKPCFPVRALGLNNGILCASESHASPLAGTPIRSSGSDSSNIDYPGLWINCCVETLFVIIMKQRS